MKTLLHILGIIFSTIIIFIEILEFLFIPVLLTIIGLFNSYSWQYYVITIGIYIVLFILIELLAHFLFKAFEKKYTPATERKINKIINILNNTSKE